jgi:hypothetical protein
MRPILGEQPPDVGFPREVALRFANDNDIAATAPLECAHDVATEKSAAAGDEDSLRRKVHHHLAGWTTGRSTT